MRFSEGKMKRLYGFLTGIILILAVAQVASAADLRFEWDAAPAGQTWKTVRVYERTGAASPFTYALKGEVAGNLTTMSITGVAPGRHVYIARSFDGNWESADSNTAETGAVPTAPGNIRITVIVNVNQ